MPEQDAYKGPDFVIIGAMKCASTTLHEQLAQQPGFFMSTPKEPNFFSDVPVFERGFDWYESLFAGARPDQKRGESSTHYTKLPTHPDAAQRLHAYNPALKLVYIMRHPVERLMSHYAHEQGRRGVEVPIDQAVIDRPEMLDYGMYFFQLQPYFKLFGRENVLPLFLPYVKKYPDKTLRLVADFVGAPGEVSWRSDVRRRNISSDRYQLSSLGNWMVKNPWMTQLRRSLVPEELRDRIKQKLPLKERQIEGAPHLPLLEARFDEDLKLLGEALGVVLNCANFNEVTAQRHLPWKSVQSTPAEAIA